MLNSHGNHNDHGLTIKSPLSHRSIPIFLELQELQHVSTRLTQATTHIHRCFPRCLDGSGVNKTSNTMKNGDLMGFYSDLMGIYSDLMGFYSDLMGFYNDLMGFYSDLMGYYWYIPSGKLT